MKTCSTCKKTKPLTEFYNKKSSKDKHSCACRQCGADKTKRWVEANPPEYGVWRTMKQRCNNPNAVDYRFYGAKGISVCARWDTFKNFYADMGDRPTKKHQLDRIDALLDYSPSNCRWVTSAENIRGKTCTKLTMERVDQARLDYSTGVKTCRELADINGVHYATMLDALAYRTWKHEEGALV